MFKNTMLLVGLLALSTTAMATDITAVATAQTKLISNGQSVSDNASVGLAVRADDFLADGLFITGQVDSLNLTPLNDARARSEVGFGYAGTYKGVNLEGSVNRVFNPILYANDYTEVRGRAGYSYFFAEIAQGVTDANRDTYVAVGAEAKLNSRWSGSAKLSAVNYDQTSFGQGTVFNNFEVSSKYNVKGNLDAFATYSQGGQDVFGADIKNQFWGGIQYRF